MCVNTVCGIKQAGAKSVCHDFSGLCGVYLEKKVSSKVVSKSEQKWHKN